MKGILNQEYKLNDNSTLPIGTEVEMITGYEVIGDYLYSCEFSDGTQHLISSDYITVTDYAPYTDWPTIRANAATAAMQSLIIVIGRKREFTAEELAEKSVMIADALIEKLKDKKKCPGQKKLAKLLTQQ